MYFLLEAPKTHTPIMKWIQILFNFALENSYLATEVIWITLIIMGVCAFWSFIMLAPI